MTEALHSGKGPIVWSQADFDSRLPAEDVLSSLRETFAGLSDGTTVQPPQVVGVFPQKHGDTIWYTGISGALEVFGVKVSPCFAKRTDGPKVSAWTLLFSMTTGDPILLCESLALTTERTAATTALALQMLMPTTARRLAIVGVGPVGMAHLRFALAIHKWNHVLLYSRRLGQDPALRQKLAPVLSDPVGIAISIESAVRESDVVLLCTSAAGPVVDYRWLRPGQLVTSISTNAPQAHEIAPEALLGLEVYCDYRATTPEVAGEMVLAALHHGWSSQSIKGDLPELLSGKCLRPTGNAPVFFRSVGLGIEDLAIASALLKSSRVRRRIES